MQESSQLTASLNVKRIIRSCCPLLSSNSGINKPLVKLTRNANCVNDCQNVLETPKEIPTHEATIHCAQPKGCASGDGQHGRPLSPRTQLTLYQPIPDLKFWRRIPEICPKRRPHR